MANSNGRRLTTAPLFIRDAAADGRYETRDASGLEIRAAAKNSGFLGTLVGYAARFESDSQQMLDEQSRRPFVERIARGAFMDTLAERREPAKEIMALWSHDESRPLGRRGANLRLSEDSQGLWFELDVLDTADGRDLVANVRAGVVNGVSFGFRVQEQTVERGTNFDTRTLRKVKLYEISPTAIPAYAGTSIGFGSDGVRDASASAAAPIRDYWAAKLGTLGAAPVQTRSTEHSSIHPSTAERIGFGRP